MKHLWLIALLFAVACNRTLHVSDSATQVAEGVSPTQAATASPAFIDDPLPTNSVVPVSTTPPTITAAPTNITTPTSTPFPTNTPTPEIPVSLGTSIPNPLHLLAPENAAQIVELAQYGGGELLDIQLSQDESILYAVFSTGLYTYDIETNQLIKAVETFIPFDPRDSTVPIRFIISPNGAYLALLKEPDIEVWDIASGVLLYTLSIGERPFSVQDFAFAPNSQSLTIAASVSSGYQIWLWHTADGTLLLNQLGFSAKFWPIGNLLMTYYGDDIELRDVTDGTLVDILTDSSNDRLLEIAFSPDGSALAAVYENSIWLWDIAAREPVQQLNRRNRNVINITFLQDGKVLSVNLQDTLRLWEVVEGSLVAELSNQYSPVLSPDRTRLITQSFSQGINQQILWRLDSQQPIELWRSDGNANFGMGAFVANGDFAYVGSNRSAYLLQSSDGSVVQSFEGEGERYGFTLTDGDMFATISWAGLHIRNAQNGRVRHTIEGQDYFLFPDEETIVTWPGGNLILWNTEEGTQLQKTSFPQSALYYIADSRIRPAGLQIPEPYIPFLRTVAYGVDPYQSPDGSLRISSNGSGIDVWDVSDYSGEGPWNQNLLYTISFPQIWDLSFSPDGQMIAATNNSSISIWHAADGSPITTIPIASQPFDFKFSSDSQRIYATNGGQYTEYFDVWDVHSGNKLFGDSYALDYQSGNSIRYCFERPLALSPTGDLVAYSSANCQIQIRQTADWQVLQTIDPGFGSSGRMRFSPDGRLLATGFQGGEIKLWDTETGTLVHTIIDHINPVVDKPMVQFAFSEDGQLFGTSANGVLRLWGIWP